MNDKNKMELIFQIPDSLSSFPSKFTPIIKFIFCFGLYACISLSELAEYIYVSIKLM
jgi:hypothetical protein